MSTIKNAEQINQRKIESLKRRHEREIKSIKNSHDDLKAELKKANQAEIVDLQDVNHRQIAKEAEKKEKLLGELKSNLDKTSELTDKELKSLKTGSEKEKANIQQNLSNDRERMIAENELYITELNERFNNQSKKVSHEGKNRVDDIKTSMQSEYSETEQFHKNKIDNKTEEFTTRFNQDDLNYKRLKDNQDSQFKKDRLSTNQKQQFELKKLSEGHLTHIEKRQDTLRKGLSDQDLVFEKKYAQQIDRHEKEFQNLDEKNKSLLDNLKASLTTEITKVAGRNEDPFFQFDTLSPKLKTFEDRVEVQVEIPEHSKQDVQLTINGKEAIVTFNRRYQDASKSHDGSIHKINKVESFTSRLPTEHILDPKSVKARYEDGAMNYTIAKA